MFVPVTTETDMDMKIYYRQRLLKIESTGILELLKLANYSHFSFIQSNIQLNARMADSQLQSTTLNHFLLQNHPNQHEQHLLLKYTVVSYNFCNALGPM